MPARLPESMIDCAMMQISCMAAESNELRAENAALLAANRDSMDHYNELRAELDALKNQPHVAVFNMAINETVGAICYDFAKHKLPSGTKFYLAPGAQPVPDGYQLVPIEPTDEMCEAAWECEGVDIHRADLAYKAMLEAAKP